MSTTTSTTRSTAWTTPRPDAYAPREEWNAEYRDGRCPSFNGERNASGSAIRYNAWWDEEETIVNTHPICYVGADNKGLDQLLAAPGGKNRDSHGTYPFPGLYKDIGPGGATEQINATSTARVVPRVTTATSTGRTSRRFGRGDAVPYTTAERIEVLSGLGMRASTR